MYNPALWSGPEITQNGVNYADVLHNGGFLDILYIGVKTGIYPCLIFMGVGAMTDFGPMLANPKSMLLGAAAQLGIYCAFLLAILFAFDANVAAAIAIVGGADGPTAIYLTSKLAPDYLGPIAIAAYSYMALIPLIQPPIMKLLTTKKEKLIRMEPPKNVSKAAKIIFPIMVTIVTALLLPSVAPLLGCLMLGNLFKECGVTERLSDTAQNALMNIVTIMLGISVGATATAANFLSTKTLLIIALGLFAFCFSTVGGVLFGKLMCWITKGKINPLRLRGSGRHFPRDFLITSPAKNGAPRRFFSFEAENQTACKQLRKISAFAFNTLAFCCKSVKIVELDFLKRKFGWKSC